MCELIMKQYKVMDIKKKIGFWWLVALSTVILMLVEHHCKQKRVKRRRVHNSSLTSHDFTQYLINGHERLTYDLLRMRIDVFLE